MKQAVVLLLALVALTGCDRRRDDGPVVVSAIGSPPTHADPSRKALSGPDKLLIDSTAQGLVRFDSAGQITPGLAERWIIIDDGMSYIFRLREAEWSNGLRVTAAEVAAILRRQIASGSRNPLKPYLSAIDEIVEMTPQVLEVRLTRPRPELLTVFAQPELAIFRAGRTGGTGPFRVSRERLDGVILRPAFDPVRLALDDVEEPSPEQSVELIGEKASRAIIRFLERRSDMVSGGTFDDWPLLASTGVAPTNLRIDSGLGLFGLAIINRSGFLSEPENRVALSQLIDRSALVAAYAPGWNASERILPTQLDSAAPPTAPAWSSLPLSDRQKGARDQIARWRTSQVKPVELRIALPDGPGSTILFGFVGAAFRSAGIVSKRVSLDAPSDLRLIDAIAPSDSARWYLANGCQPCSPAAGKLIDEARDAPDLSARAQKIAEADSALTQDGAYIPIARPLRWSLVALRLSRWQANARTAHPLNLLRAATK